MRDLSIRGVRDESGTYRAWCPHLPGCLCRGQTSAQAISRLVLAVRGYLAAMHNAPSDRSVRIAHPAIEASRHAGQAAIPMCG